MKIHGHKVIVIGSCLKKLKHKLKHILKHKKCKCCKKQKPKIKFTAIYRINNQIIISEDIKMIILTDVQKVLVTVSPVSAKGNAAPVDGIPVWEVSDTSLLSVVPSEDGLSAVVTAVGPIGLAQVSVKGDADLGEGVVEIVGILDVEVVASSATTFALTPGVPELA